MSVNVAQFPDNRDGFLGYWNFNRGTGADLELGPKCNAKPDHDVSMCYHRHSSLMPTMWNNYQQSHWQRPNWNQWNNNFMSARQTYNSNQWRAPAAAFIHTAGPNQWLAPALRVPPPGFGPRPAHQPQAYLTVTGSAGVVTADSNSWFGQLN